VVDAGVEALPVSFTTTCGLYVAGVAVTLVAEHVYVAEDGEHKKPAGNEAGSEAGKT
jgi:hypothetical protein